MSEGFSGIVRISNVNDFIAPPPNCIVPLRNPKESDSSLVTLKLRREEKPSSEQKKVNVALADCLACNGCVTTAETILIQEQSSTQFLHSLATSSLSVVTLSPQSIASIAVQRGLSMAESARRLTRQLKARGAKYVIDSSFARCFSLLLSYEELKGRTEPIFASACPGWVCYAEKTQGAAMLDLMSRVRSPQAISGALVKDYLARTLGLDPASIFHASVMPCFDKKLEASRGDFLVPTTQIREVDCVISTAELDALLDDDFAQSPCPHEEATPSDWLSDLSVGRLIGQAGGASGGYAEFVVQRFARDSMRHSGTTVSIRRTVKSRDLEELEIVDTQERVLFLAAKAYGFRNIQNLVQKVKRGKCNYNYVEVMACPSGCANGGGQVRAATRSEQEVVLRSVCAVYDEIEQCEDVEGEIARVRREWLALNASMSDLLHTTYHIVDRNIMQGASLRW